MVYGGVMQFQLQILPKQLKFAMSERASHFVSIHLPLSKARACLVYGGVVQLQLEVLP